MVEDGHPKLVTTSDIKGRGVYGNSDITTKQEEIMFLFSFFACFWSERQQLGLAFWGARPRRRSFHLFNWCQLKITYTKYFKIFFKFFDQGKSLSLFTWWYGVEGVQWKKWLMVKMWHFSGDVIIERPHNTQIHTTRKNLMLLEYHRKY